MLGGTEQQSRCPPGWSRQLHGPEQPPIPVGTRMAGTDSTETGPQTGRPPLSQDRWTHCLPPKTSPLTCKRFLLCQHTPDHDGEAGRKMGQVSICEPEAHPHSTMLEGNHARVFKSEGVGEGEGGHHDVFHGLVN